MSNAPDDSRALDAAPRSELSSNEPYVHCTYDAAGIAATIEPTSELSSREPYVHCTYGTARIAANIEPISELFESYGHRSYNGTYNVRTDWKNRGRAARELDATRIAANIEPIRSELSASEPYGHRSYGRSSARRTYNVRTDWKNRGRVEREVGIATKVEPITNVEPITRVEAT
jgi:hypothetical protein